MMLRAAPRRASNVLAIHDEAGLHRDVVVKAHGGVIRLVRMPVDARRVRGLRMRVHRFDQRASYALAAHVRRREQILQIADRTVERGAAVIDEMHETDHALALERDERVHGFVAVEEARPRGTRDRLGQRRRARTLVEVVIAVPQRTPCRVVVGRHGAHMNRFAQSRSPGGVVCEGKCQRKRSVAPLLVPRN
ncbi:hypothetical protein PT2222_100135 [Paraburkholderia tropica]